MDAVVSNEDMTLPRTHIEEMDFAEMKHRQAKELAQIDQDGQSKRARLRVSEARQQTWQIVSVGFFLAAVSITIVLVFWNPWAPPKPAGPDNEGLREIACVENGGGFVPEDLLAVGSRGLCVYPGKKVTGLNE